MTKDEVSKIEMNDSDWSSEFTLLTSEPIISTAENQASINTLVKFEKFDPMMFKFPTFILKISP